MADKEEGLTPESKPAVKKSTADVVTSENLAAYRAKKWGLEPEKKEEPTGGTKSEPAAGGVSEGEGKDGNPEKKDPVTETPDEKKKRETKERWDKLTSDRREAMEERDRLKAENAALMEKLNPPAAQPKAEPDPKDYTDITKYRDDLKKWERAEVARELKEQQDRQDAERAEADWKKRVSDAANAIPDFRSTMEGSDVKGPDWVRDAIKASDVGPQILYYLAKNPEESEKINKMTPINAVRYLGRIETMIEKGTDEPPTAKKESSNAPPPISGLKGLSGGSDVLGRRPDGSWRSHADYLAARKAGKI